MPLDLPRWDARPGDAARTIEVIDRWAASRAMARVVAAFGGDTGDHRGDDLLGYLEQFSAHHFDFRSGRERNLATDARLTAEQDSLVLDVAPDLGLAGITSPRHAHYDTVLMTGGMVRAGIVKPRFVARLLADGLTAGRVVFLGAFRGFLGDESRIARALGVMGDDEVDSMVAGVRRAFRPLEKAMVAERIDENRNASWREYTWRTGGVRLTVLATPSSAPEERRANTADTLRFWAEHNREPGERSILVVTTPVYVPYQGAGAVDVLGAGRGLAVETIGVDARASNLGRLSQEFLPQHHLQELRSAVGAMRALRGRLAP